MFKYQYQTLIYAQFFDDENGFTINLNGVDQTYKGNILGEGNIYYFNVILL